MKHLLHTINEALSANNLKTLKEFVNDENFDLILPKIKQACKEADLIGEHFKKYFTDKGLDNMSFANNKEELGLRIASYFANVDKNYILKDIVKHNGILSFSELLAYSDQADKDNKNNIFDICENYHIELLEKDSDDNEDGNFRDVAEKISNITNVISHSANVGKFEILLKFMLKENAAKHDHGDVSINYNGNDGFGIEVKGGDTLNKAARIGGQSIRSTKELCTEFCNLLNISKQPDMSFLGSASANERLKKILIANDINDIDLIISSYVKAFAYQYQVDNNEDVEKLISSVTKYNDSKNIFSINDDEKIEIKNLTDLNGVVQLYFYSKKERWNSIIVINQTTGYYRIINADEILDFDKVFKTVKFYFFEGNESATGRRCASRIFPK